jgi:predicted transcriptional regulator
VRSLGPLEERVVEILWRESRGLSVREVHGALGHELAYTTVMTTLDRLFKKGLLVRERDGCAYRYSPRVTREVFTAGLLRRLLEPLLRRGPVRPMLATLVDAVGERDRALLPELLRLVREKERGLRRREKA